MPKCCWAGVKEKELQQKAFPSLSLSLSFSVLLAFLWVAMFVLPRMKVPPEGLRVSRSSLPTAASSDPPMSPLLLSYWGLPFYSELPEEGQARTEIMESYLSDLVGLVRLRNASLKEAFDKSVASLMHDEAVERGFIEEDANLLAWRSFIDYTFLEALERLKKRERTARLHIIDTYFSFTLRALGCLETLDRKHVATQFLDSLFLKRCQVSPGWMWRRVPPLLDEAYAESTRAAEPPWAIALFVDESSARNCLVEQFYAEFRLSLEVFATSVKWRVHKRQTFQLASMRESMLNKQATVIQSVFRGYRERKRHRRCAAAAA
ncbi:DNA-damage inducible protein DDI1-like protein, putative [Trypanosoma cruzi marinkellei]|uniref:DNA-damage inducible protein DDI1-like protein, putative n=1 Tax=Trypanosoma cruzi marinkellei TaxID=85056 RepID=K2NSE8_TRYCR|nr:DNA-damage inducible protein DDI1-like protein, putative [Trypanosoma cruzi marinkellei]